MPLNSVRSNLIVSVAPTVEPVTATEVKAHIGELTTDNDTLLTQLIASARTFVEERYGIATTTQTLILYLDRFPSLEPIYLPRPPFQSLTSVAYTDSAGDPQTWDSADYQIEDLAYKAGSNPSPARLTPAYGGEYPVTRDVLNAVTITYKAGWGDATSDVPQDIRTAIMMMVDFMFRFRGPVDDTSTSRVELAAQQTGLDALLNRYRGSWF